MAPYLMVLIRTNKIIFVVFKNQSSNITFLALGKGQVIFIFWLFDYFYGAFFISLFQLGSFVLRNSELFMS